MTDAVTRILVIDDDPVVLALMTETLRQRGYQPSAMQDSREAARVLENEAFDLVVTDVVMPDVHGLQILDIARHRTPEVPVLLVTGHADRHIIREGFTQGAYAFIEKPFQLNEFVSMVEQALRSARS